MDKKIEVFHGWEIVEKIGEGGFSTVYKIRKTDSSDFGEYYAALKVVSIPRSKEEYRSLALEGYDDATINGIITSQVNKIVEEFRLMARFKGNSNIVSYEDHKVVPHTEDKGSDILIRMELLSPLMVYYEKNPLDVKETVKLGVDICKALELCGKFNVIHRDIKPQNVFVNEFGDYKLGDFGIARTMDHTTQATKIGTYTYIAPEVHKGETYNSNVDIYSLGLVLYWLLNERRLPFVPLPPATPTPTQISEAVSKRLGGEQLPPPKYGSENLKQIVLKACAFNPKDRYQSAAEMRIELEKELIAIVSPSGKTAAATVASSAINDATQIGLGEGKSIDNSAKQPDSLSDKTTPLVSPAGLGGNGTAKSTDSKSATSSKPTTDNKSVHGNKPTSGGKPTSGSETVASGSNNSGNSKNNNQEDKKSKKPLIILLLLLLVAVAVGAFLLLGSGDNGKDNPSDGSLNSETVSENGESENASENSSEAISNGESENASNDTSEDISIDTSEAVSENGASEETSSEHIHEKLPSAIKSDALSHWYLCECGEETEKENHTFGEWVTIKEATEEETGEKEHSCSVCKYKETETIPTKDHKHSYATTWSNNETTHWYECACGEMQSAESHSFSPWNVIKEATETQTGEMERSCSVCKYKETATVPVLSHKHSYSNTWQKNETTHWKECSCGDKTNVANHSFSSWTTVTEATCLKDGSQKRTCSACGYTETKIIAATGYITVTFNANGGSVSQTSKDAYYQNSYGSLPTPTRANYTFNGWFTAKTGGTKVTSSTTVTSSTNQTLYAQWTALPTNLTLSASSGSVTLNPTAISLNNTSLTLTNGNTSTLTATLTYGTATKTFTATVTPSDAGDLTVTATSSNTSVATVTTSRSGNVTTITITAKTNGSATITVKANGNTSLSKTYALTVTKDSAVTWTSSATSIATVSNGTVTAKGVGNATITAKTSNSKSATCSVKVISNGVQVGDTITFGTYEQDNNTSNGAETIEWRVLEVKDGKALVISKYALDCKRYNTSETDVTWETCTLRSWLNNEFYNAAFSSSEKSRINSTNLINADNPSYGTEGGNNTTDKVFLLSIDEAKAYFSSDEDRKCYSTEYAKANGAYVSTSYGTCWWWLRSPGNDRNRAASVNGTGDVHEYGDYVSYSSNAVRPALWINLES